MQHQKIYILILLLYPSQAVFANDVLSGIWIGNDRASSSIYYKMRIENEKVSWGGGNPYNPPCASQYEINETKEVSNYPNNVLSKVNPDGYKLVKIKVKSNDCTDNNVYFQFAIPLNTPNYAEVVVYDTDGKMIGWHNFTRESP